VRLPLPFVITSVLTTICGHEVIVCGATLNDKVVNIVSPKSV